MTIWLQTNELITNRSHIDQAIDQNFTSPLVMGCSSRIVAWIFLDVSELCEILHTFTIASVQALLRDLSKYRWIRIYGLTTWKRIERVLRAPGISQTAKRMEKKQRHAILKSIQLSLSSADITISFAISQANTHTHSQSSSSNNVTSFPVALYCWNLSPTWLQEYLVCRIERWR